MVNAREWTRRAKAVKRTIDQAIQGFESVSTDYADARDAAANNGALKEEVDAIYSALVDAKKQLNALQAGGRTRRHRRK